MIPRFYLPQTLVVGTWITLPDAAARHARVLRLKPGEAISLFNGTGGGFNAIVHKVGKQIQAEIITYDPDAGHHAEPPYQITLAQSIAGGTKMDWLIEKAVELGIHRIVPLITANSVVQLADERAARRNKHWQAIAIAACQQCGRYRVPDITLPMNFPDWLATLPPMPIVNAASSTRFLLSPRATGSVESLPVTPPIEPVILLVGPESGLTRAEESTAHAHKFIAVHLGPRILRTETASLAMLAVLANRWEGRKKPRT